MKTKLTLIGTMAAACAAFQLSAMPTEEETRRAEPAVQRLLASERAAIKSGRRTRSEVAVAAMKLADKAETDAAKLLLMKGAFVLYVQDGNIKKAAEALDALVTAIPDMPPQYVTNIIDTALLGAHDVEYKFSYKLEDGFAILTGVEPKPVGTLVVPDEIDGYLVTRIGGYNEESPFWGCDQMTRVVLPKGLEFTSFDPGAFISCKSLSSIEISDSNYQFASLDGALYSKDLSTLCVYPKTRESIELPPETKKIRFCAFRGCALKTAKIPEGVEEIGRWNLCECPNLESVELPKSLKYWGVCAVHGSDKVTKMVFNGDAPRVDGGWQELFTAAPADLVVEVRKGTKGWKSPDSTELPERWPTDQKESRNIRFISAVYDAMPSTSDANIPLSCLEFEANDAGFSLTKCDKAAKGKLRIPPTYQRRPVTSIGRDAVHSCSNLTSVTIPASVTSIGDGAFFRCTFTDIEIPNAVTNIGTFAFGWCTELKSVVIPDSVTRVGAHSFSCCQGMTSLKISGSLQDIEEFAFYGCRSLTSVTIPASVTNISACAFQNCKSLKSVTIPDSVTTIGEKAFASCHALTNITIPDSVTSIGENLFDGCNNLTSIQYEGKCHTVEEFMKLFN